MPRNHTVPIPKPKCATGSISHRYPEPPSMMRVWAPLWLVKTVTLAPRAKDPKRVRGITRSQLLVAPWGGVIVQFGIPYLFKQARFQNDTHTCVTLKTEIGCWAFSPCASNRSSCPSPSRSVTVPPVQNGTLSMPPTTAPLRAFTQSWTEENNKEMISRWPTGSSSLWLGSIANIELLDQRVRICPPGNPEVRQ